MGCRSRRRTAALRTRGPPARGGGSRPCTPSPCHTHHGVTCVIPPSLCTMCHGREWPLPPLPHTETARGGRRPLGGAPRTPAAAPPDWRVVGPAGARYEPPPPSIHLPRPPDPPPVPPAGAARPARAVRARAAPCCIIRAVRAARRAEGPRTTPSAPPPRQLALKALRRLASCCAGGARRPGASYPPPTGVCTHGTGHRHPLGGSHTTTHHSTTARGGRE